MTKTEMSALGWKQCDFIIVTGDAYVDHPSFGAAIIARVLESTGFKVGIIAQPDWKTDGDWLQLGAPRFGFGITAGNLDSMVNHYTAQKKIRHNDAYSPDDKAGLRPDRATIIYCNRVRQLFKNVPVIIGGVEASMRRIAHYDYWQDKIRNPILADAKADILVYGMGEKPLLEIADKLRNGIPVREITDVPGTVVFDAPPDGSDRRPRLSEEPVIPAQAGIQSVLKNNITILPDAETYSDKAIFHQMSQLFHHNFQDQIIWQKVAGRFIRHNPPPEPMTEKELDSVYRLPFMRLPHPRYDGKTIPAFIQIKDSITTHRGCMGGCNFCTIGYHQGRAIQSRSEQSILKELETLTKTKTFKGTVTDLGGPSANMYKIKCRLGFPVSCKRDSCLYPDICRQLETSHQQSIDLLNKTLKMKAIKHVFVSSGIRYDLALKDENYIRQIAAFHTSGLLKVAPEHTEPDVLKTMGKPSIKLYLDFCELFFQASRKAQKNNSIVPYIIAGHPGSTIEDAIRLGLWLKQQNLRLEQVQEFTPTSMTVSTCMYYTGLDFETGKPIYVPKGRDVRLQKALVMWHDPKNKPLVKEALSKSKRLDMLSKYYN
ncbi:MAG: YgiQ family radical SAM protein [Candidatus Cloacimonadaceae bacterium]